MARFQSLSLRHQTGLICAGLLFLVATAFWQVARCDFLIYDDSQYVVTNDMVRRGLGAESIAWAFQKYFACNWHPLTWISHMADVELYGMRPAGHHVTNLIFHALNTLLVFALLKRLTGSLWRSALVAALFGLHPTHVESVAWVAERKDVLSTFFGLLSLILYARYAQRQSARPFGATKRSEGGSTLDYALALVFFALGLMSKPMLVTWPFVLLLLDYWPLQRVSGVRGQGSGYTPWLRLLREKLPFFALSIGSCVVTFFAQKAGGAVQSLEHLPPEMRLGNALVSYIRYLGKTIWPANLSIYYPSETWSVLTIAAAVALLGTGLFVAWRWRQQRPWLLFGLGWFLGTLVPVIGLVQVGGQSMADRYQYLPQIGLFIAAAWLLGELAGWQPAWRNGAVVLGAVAVVACLVLTPIRIRDWKNSETLFQQALRVTKDNHIAHNNLGLHYLAEKKYDLAISSIQEAIALRPAYAAARNNLALALSSTGKPAEAAEQLREALRLKPELYEARVNLASIYNTQGRFTEALKLLEQAVQESPEYPDGRYVLASVLAELGRLDEAMQQVQSALRLRPDYAEAKNCQGNICLKRVQLDEAARHYEEALRLNPKLAEARSNLGLVRAGQGKYREALAEYEAALRLDPGLIIAHLGLAIVFEQLGQLTEGANHWAEALKLSPDLTWAHEQRGMLLARQGKVAEALPHFAEVIRVQPGNARARAFYGLALDQSGRPALAAEQYRQAINLNTNLPEALNNLAWILAANADPALRNGAEAVQFAERACELTGDREAMFVGTLAAAYAEAGRFDEAVAAAQKAQSRATANGDAALAENNRQLADLYQRRLPFHESAPTNQPSGEVPAPAAKPTR